jgi:hypothetical protein
LHMVLLTRMRVAQQLIDVLLGRHNLHAA